MTLTHAVLGRSIAWQRMLGILLALTALVYAAGLRGDFMFDDIPNITTNSKVQIQSLEWGQLRQAWNSGVVGVGGRALAMLSFGINHAVSGMNPAAFKFVNLLLHLMAGVMLYHLTRVLARLVDGRSGDGLALWVAGAWLLHPVNVTPVLLVVQRMTELAALFSFASVLLYLRLRTAPPHGRLKRWFAWLSLPLLWGLGFLGKETAVLVPLYLMALEYFVLSRANGVSPLPKVPGRVLIGTLMLGVAATAVLAYLGRWIFALEAYADRDFTLNERLMTEARILWFYVKLILLPALSDFNLFHDGLAISRGLLSPWTTAAAILGWLTVLALLVRYGRRMPLIGFGIAWFLAGHLLESTFIPLELIFEHRNYAPSFGLLLAVGVAMRWLHDKLGRQRGSWLIPVLAGASLAILAAMTAQRANAYGSLVSLYEFEVDHNPNSYRAHQNLAVALYEENLATLGADPDLRRTIHAHLGTAAELDAEVTYPYLARQHIACVFHDPIDPRWSEALLERWAGPRPYGERMHVMATFANAAIGRSLCMDEALATKHFQTYLGNPRVPRRYHAEIQLRYAEFVHVVGQDRSKALTLARQAYAEDQTPALAQKYAHFLQRLGESAEAERILKSIPFERRSF